ncbi:hypothetical protein M427DRAFT_69260 [Gonapodya prolifera JEL478]|uniref:Uncharacterized protein n=1 Tax=Gonapodya prolifera (strain JEL478) TaxID=1344416 RepID=A0A139AHJ9_GONPJ|nr:hypothetical protein M427DRAFT_69260 [Gonapodya prolifera JEL478]|eukprot:KXS16286.1 hypothetical protein M427DRAFT_69260 [Gonapodya prolifera JEL478]
MIPTSARRRGVALPRTDSSVTVDIDAMFTVASLDSSLQSPTATDAKHRCDAGQDTPERNELERTFSDDTLYDDGVQAGGGVAGQRFPSRAEKRVRWTDPLHETLVFERLSDEEDVACNRRTPVRRAATPALPSFRNPDVLFLLGEDDPAELDESWPPMVIGRWSPIPDTFPTAGESSRPSSPLRRACVSPPPSPFSGNYAAFPPGARRVASPDLLGMHAASLSRVIPSSHALRRAKTYPYNEPHSSDSFDSAPSSPAPHRALSLARIAEGHGGDELGPDTQGAEPSAERTDGKQRHHRRAGRVAFVMTLTG